MSTVLDRDPLQRAGHHPLKGLAGKRPATLRDLKRPSVRDVRGEEIGCEQAARELGIGRTQMWRLADQGKIDCERRGTLAEDLETTVHAVGKGYVILPYKLAKRWQSDAGTHEVLIGHTSYHVRGVTWDPSRAQAGVKTRTLLWLEESTEEIEAGMPVYIPEGKWGRPVYQFKREDVVEYAERRRQLAFARQAEAATRALYDLLELIPGGLLVPTLRGVVTAQNPARRLRPLHPLE